MKRYWWIILLIIIIGVILLIITEKEKYFNPIVIQDNNIFNTIKEKPYLDTIIYSGIKSLELKGLIIVIRPLTAEVKNNFSSEIELKAHILGKDSSYVIWVDNNLSRYEYIEIFSHELIHLKQYYTNKLIINNNIITWNGKKINNIINYKDRPWEIEAFDKQKSLESKMNNILY